MQYSKIASVTAALCLFSTSFWTAASWSQDENIAKLEAVLKTVMPRSAPDSVAESSVPGLYEAVYGAQVLYISGNGRYMVEGDIYDIKNKVNLTEGRRQGGRVKAIDNIDKGSFIEFKPKGEVKYTVTAFTDIDCGYCRKLHKEMKDYNKLGIAIRYASFPRAGIDSKSYYKAENVWCAEDQQKAMNFAKAGASLEQLKDLKKVAGKKCGDTIKQHYQTAREVGVTGTPTLVMDDGQVIPGYVPASRLIGILQQK